jgi:hypothetical protein
MEDADAIIIIIVPSSMIIISIASGNGFKVKRKDDGEEATSSVHATERSSNHSLQISLFLFDSHRHPQPEIPRHAMIFSLDFSIS